MKITAIQGVFLAVADVEAVAGAYERIGLRMSPAVEGVRTLAVGGPANLFTVHLSPDPERVGLTGVALAVDDLDVLLAVLAERDLRPRLFEDADGRSAWLERRDEIGTELLFRRPARPMAERHAEAGRAGRLAHELPLRRLDHLASVAADLAPGVAFWNQCLQIPLFGEVRTPTMVIRQLKIGDAVFELLGAVDAASPVWQRPQGLISMASWEVGDLDGVVGRVRRAGLMVTDGAVGPLPGTRVATVAGAELGGLNMQLLQYVESA